MSNLIKQNKEHVAQNSLVLKKTRHINQDDIEVNVNWASIYQDYETYQKGSWEEKAQVSLINSIVYQQRAAFILTRDCFRTLLQTDKNWKTRAGLKNSNWKVFLKEVSGLIKLSHYVKGKKCKIGVFIVVNSELLSMLSVNLKTQISEVEKYIQINSLDAGDGQGDGQGDGELEKEWEGGLEDQSTNHSILKSFSGEEKNSIPEYLNKPSRWYQHYLKSSYNEEIFNSLPEVNKKKLYNQTLSLEEIDPADAKDKFVSALTRHLMKNKPQPASLKDLDFGDL